jgi:hypothetical protein
VLFADFLCLYLLELIHTSSNRFSRILDQLDS